MVLGCGACHGAYPSTAALVLVKNCVLFSIRLASSTIEMDRLVVGVSDGVTALVR